jgi:hypothetical protein
VLAFFAFNSAAKPTPVHTFSLGKIKLGMTEEELIKARPDLFRKADDFYLIQYSSKSYDSPFIQDQQFNVYLDPSTKRVLQVGYHVFFSKYDENLDVIKKAYRQKFIETYGIEDNVLGLHGKNKTLGYCWGFCPSEVISLTEHSGSDPWDHFIPGKRLVVREIVSNNNYRLAFSLIDGMARIKNEDRSRNQYRDYEKLESDFIGAFAGSIGTPSYIKSIQEHVNL